MANCTYIDGIASSQAIDTAGEVVDLAGLDCSSLVGAAFNFEHESKLPAQIVGKILEIKKIFSKEDCENERHEYFWNKYRIPFLYCMGRLFDDKKESSKEVAALFKDDAENPGEPKMVAFSVEGAKIHKEGMKISRSIARKVTITHIPANKTCVAEILPSEKASKKDNLDSLFKTEPTEVEFFNPNSNYLEFLQKKEDILAKAQVPGSKIPTSEEAAKRKALGQKPFSTVGGVPQWGPIKKALEAGSGMAAPSDLAGGAALGKESIVGKKKKSEWLSRAEEEYEKWEKKEQFREFMQKRLPTLALSEIDAIGRMVVLKKAFVAEETLQKMFPHIKSTKTGVHQPSHKDSGGGTSRMGVSVRSGNINTAKATARATIEGAKSIKPNLPKSEDIEKTTDIMMASEKEKK